VDCLVVLYPAFDFVILFGHSQGHDRQREGALVAIRMSKEYGGAQPHMRDTKIELTKGFLGPFSPRLSVGDCQSMVFKEGDDGPFWMTPQQRLLRMHDCNTENTKEGEKTKAELIQDLEAAAVALPRGKHHSKLELQTFSQANAIPLRITRPVIKEGWLGKPKGLMQVLLERGHIDTTELASYTLDGRKDRLTGEVDASRSLRRIMAECLDFVNEETALQVLGRKLGVLVDRTPKFHAELAGEGIEYSWACSKAQYRRIPVAAKKGRDNFKAQVRLCTDPTQTLNKERVSKFAARARAYICTYYWLAKQQEEQQRDVLDADEADDQDTSKQQQLLFSDIERS
jgi:hypothetical protein